MDHPSLESSSIWKKLLGNAQDFARPEMHLGCLIQKPGRLESFSLKTNGFFYDFSRQRINEEVMAHLRELAGEKEVLSQFRGMMGGLKVNRSEQRAALHTAARSFSNDPVTVGGVDVMSDIRRVRREMERFSARILSGDITGTTGKRFSDVVIIGIGGSGTGGTGTVYIDDIGFGRPAAQ